ncbi:DUF4350 domain-containing protein [Aurantiacibacter spongiae]|uniref:DUF4350 domain-containing protein n=1 Tax=Aurantiacibacter spongiae TaxID=2488860 RepID=A0A3N5CRU8_9SPHN|nr:DUF4350 domain-containing protein [Aurantiacibacter spongiae]RPF71873.1 DUF4350 domain-containing protein [Aurantiacibacter spongiae]
MTGRPANPFRPGAVLAVLTTGALAFLLLLYSIGQGWTGSEDRNGGEHAASNGLTGFAGLVSLLEGTGHDVSLSRNPGGFADYNLTILTPPLWSDGEKIGEIIAHRQSGNWGPTILVLPKWQAGAIPEDAGVEAKDGWVFIDTAISPGWFAQTELTGDARLATGPTRGWRGFGLSGSLPDPEQAQALLEGGASGIEPLVRDGEGDILAGIVRPHSDDAWPLIIVFEPDLMNNYGLAAPTRAWVAVSLIDEAMDGEDMPVVFDLTLAGLGASENLLTLAFSPPFLAATLCLLLAALVIGWRAFNRFGPPRAELPGMARGKRQLARNGAALVARVKRFHLLAEPYAALVGNRIARDLGIHAADREAREGAIDEALQGAGHDGPGFARTAHDLRNARHPREIIRSAGALKSLERTVRK